MILITGSGYADNGEQLDSERAKYFYQHLSHLLPLIASGINIRGFFVWTLFDNFQWSANCTAHYGIYSILLNDTDLSRVPKLSTKIISDVFKTKEIPDFADSINQIEFKVPLEKKRSWGFSSFFNDLLETQRQK